MADPWGPARGSHSRHPRGEDPGAARASCGAVRGAQEWRKPKEKLGSISGARRDTGHAGTEGTAGAGT